MNTKQNAHRKTGRTPCVMALALALVAVCGSTQALAGGQGNARGQDNAGGQDNARGQDKKAQHCSARTIRGDYGIQMQGTRPVPPPNSGIESVVGVVLRTYDGHGNFTQIDNIKGSVTGIVPDRPGMGTYEVNPDCSGVTLFQPDPSNPNLVIKERIIVLQDGAEIWTMTESPAPLMMNSVAKRIKVN